MVWGHEHPVNANTSLDRFEHRPPMSYKLYPIMNKVFLTNVLYRNPTSVRKHPSARGQTVFHEFATVDVHHTCVVFVRPLLSLRIEIYSSM